jgi:hypothetical protein
MINNADIKDIYSYLKGDAVDTEKIDNITKRLALIVKQIEVQEEFNSKMDEISKEFETLKK